MKGYKMTYDDELYGSDKNLINKLVDEFFDKHPQSKELLNVIKNQYAELTLRVFLDELYLKGYEIKKKNSGKKE